MQNKSFEVKQDETVCILGLGYVGLTLSSVLADVGYQVVGVDRNDKIVDGLKISKPHFHEKGLDELLVSLAQKSNAPRYYTSLQDSSSTVYIITVGTPILRPSLQPNLDYVRNATGEVGKVLKRGDMVILRSTVPVGTTRNVALPMLEQSSGLKAGLDFDLAFCPERTVEGKALKELRELPQIVGGLSDQSTERASRLFRRSTHTIIDVGKLESAEMLKIMDNTFRDVMFSYANQMALLCEALDLDMVPLVRAANQGYNRNNIPVPSPGVGGACLSKDPYILASVCKASGVDDSLFLLGRKINESMPLNACKRIKEELKKNGKDISGANVFVLGFSFKGKPETSDMRDSPTLDLIKILKEEGAIITGHDPLVPKDEIVGLGVEWKNVEDGFIEADAAIIMINHASYEEMDIVSHMNQMNKPAVLLDGWHLFSSDSFGEVPGVSYFCVGQ
jgi:UDP-N-acetyl-D-mannosaminuronic acid dehydrogenase